MSDGDISKQADKAADKAANKKKYEYDIGCVPSKFWYMYFGSYLIVPLVALFTNIKVKPDKDFLKEEGPIVVLGNHPSYLDPMVMDLLTHGRAVNFVAGEFLFRTKGWGHIFKLGGAIPKKQFVVDTFAVKAMMKVLKRGGVLGIFPEATRFVDGKSITFDDGVARMIKKTNSAIYIARSHGAYLTFPRWSQSGLRRGKVTAEFTKKLHACDVAKMTVEEIQAFILDGLDYDENDYSRQAHPCHKNKALASGLQNVAYACPKCNSEFTMKFDGGQFIKCNKCGNKVSYGTDGLLSPVGEQDKCFEDLHQWTDWEKNITKEQLAKGDFEMKLEAKLFKVFDELDFANTGNGTVTVFSDRIVYEGTDCAAKDGIPYHKGKIRKGFENRTLETNSSKTQIVFELASMKGLVGKYGKCFEIYDSKGELFRFHVDGQKVYKVHQIVELMGKHND